MVKSEQMLTKLFNELGEIFSLNKAAKCLQISNTDASKCLARWTQQGKIIRIYRGTYAHNSVLEEPWLIAPALFAPCYIGGWSAAQHWDLTEQIFRDTCVMTQQAVRKQKQIIYDIPFILTHMDERNLFGLKKVWRKQIAFNISDPHKTIIDMLNKPQVAGGLTHLINCLENYFLSEHCDHQQLLFYAMRLNSGAVFKRLGFLATELIGINNELVEICHQRLTQGKSLLDPKAKCTKLITRWRLFIPENFDIKSELK